MTTPVDYMDKLREALKTGRRVEIFSINDNLNEWGLEANADLEDACAARILDEEGTRVTQDRVDAEQARELLKLGAVEV